jgi:hypothetical protein
MADADAPRDHWHTFRCTSSRFKLRHGRINGYDLAREEPRVFYNLVLCISLAAVAAQFL